MVEAQKMHAIKNCISIFLIPISKAENLMFGRLTIQKKKSYRQVWGTPGLWSKPSKTANNQNSTSIFKAKSSYQVGI